MYRILYLCILLCNFVNSGTHCYPTYSTAFMSTIGKYSRQYTVLEIGKNSYLPKLPLNQRMIGAVMLLDPDSFELEKITAAYRTSVCVMAPPVLTLSMLDRLSRCEHFDVVIVHDISSFVEGSVYQLVSVLTNLGDHVFIKADSQELENVLMKSKRIEKVADTERPLFVSHKKKKGFDLARYTQRKSRSSKLRYEVHASFSRKEFNKKGLPYPLEWVHGINLVTFTMFSGIHPCDAHIRKSFQRFKKTCKRHNDMVMGNIMLQGTRLIPIDIGDTRRSANFDQCISAALRAFKEGNARLDDPQAWIDQYYQEVG